MAKAEATRLYCLRSHAKGKLHAVGLFLVRSGDWLKAPLAVDSLAQQEALLQLDAPWLASLLVASE